MMPRERFIKQAGNLKHFSGISFQKPGKTFQIWPIILIKSKTEAHANHSGRFSMAGCAILEIKL